jgi:hypothetical protein
MHIARKQLPSLLMGEGSGGGGPVLLPSHPPFPCQGKGCLPPPVSPSRGRVIAVLARLYAACKRQVADLNGR